MAEGKTAAKTRVMAILFGAIDIASAIMVYIGVFEGLPARYWPVDGGAVLLIGLFGIAGAGLLAGAGWARPAAIATSIVSLVIGLVLVTTLAFTASYLAGIYGPVGRGGALILGLIAALMLPYLVALPLAQLAWLEKRSTASVPAEAPRAASMSEA
jgi:hypothetical protein